MAGNWKQDINKSSQYFVLLVSRNLEVECHKKATIREAKNIAQLKSNTVAISRNGITLKRPIDLRADVSCRQPNCTISGVSQSVLPHWGSFAAPSHTRPNRLFDFIVISNGERKYRAINAARFAVINPLSRELNIPG